MSFFTGRATFSRFKITGNVVETMFDQQHLDKLSQHAAGRQRLASSDGIEVGWSASAHILDTAFEMEKNVIDDMLLFALRIDSQKLPSDLLKAYYLTDLKGLCANNQSGKPSLRQKREAKESARERLEHEAKDGRFLKRKAIEVLWDLNAGELYFATTSFTNIDRLYTLFKDTFGLGLEPLTASTIAEGMSMGNEGILVDTSPSLFVPGSSTTDIAWILDERNRDFIGNEFALWLWYFTATQSDTIKLADGSEVAIMLARALTLDCPRGQTGIDGFKHEGPTRLPEAMRAIQAGKLPRKLGMTMVRNGDQYELLLHAETLAIGSARLPALEEEGDHARLVERAGQIRAIRETMDLLFGVFVELRLSSEWSETLAKMQRWLGREEKAAATAA
jgi:hypothetical protein